MTPAPPSVVGWSHATASETELEFTRRTGGGAPGAFHDGVSYSGAESS